MSAYFDKLKMKMQQKGLAVAEDAAEKLYACVSETNKEVLAESNLPLVAKGLVASGLDVVDQLAYAQIDKIDPNSSHPGPV